jgi:hypothetical protein
VAPPDEGTVRLHSTDAAQLARGLTAALVIIVVMSAGCEPARPTVGPTPDAGPTAPVAPSTIPATSGVAEPSVEQATEAPAAKKPPLARRGTTAAPSSTAAERGASQEAPPVKQPAPKMAAITADRRFEACRAKLKTAHKNRVLHDLDWNGTSEPHVVVGPSFVSLPPEAQLEFARNVSCFLVAGAFGQSISFDVVDWRTREVVGRFSGGHFVMR